MARNPIRRRGTMIEHQVEAIHGSHDEPRLDRGPNDIQAAEARLAAKTRGSPTDSGNAAVRHLDAVTSLA